MSYTPNEFGRAVPVQANSQADPELLSAIKAGGSFVTTRASTVFGSAYAGSGCDSRAITVRYGPDHQVREMTADSKDTLYRGQKVQAVSAISSNSGPDQVPAQGSQRHSAGPAKDLSIMRCQIGSP